MARISQNAETTSRPQTANGERMSESGEKFEVVRSSPTDGRDVVGTYRVKLPRLRLSLSKKMENRNADSGTG